MTAIACATGCLLRDRHLSTCEGDCQGCLPRPADLPSAVCLTCRPRLIGAVMDAPDLVARLRTLLQPGSAGTSEQVRGKRHAPPAPINVGAVADADEIVNLLVQWARVILDGRDMVAPEPGVLQGAHGQPVGIRPTSKINPANGPANLILTHADWALRQEWAGEMVDEITKLVRTTQHRWPDSERDTWTDQPCPACGHLSVRVRPPSAAGAARLITCEHSDCGRIFTEDEWEDASA